MQNSDDLDQEALNHLPNGIKLSWGLTKQPRRGPKGELSVKKIVDAAIAIADQDGLAAVSMNRVASQLGFTTMSLYRYISSKDDLLFLMQDAVCDLTIPPERIDKDWRAEMREYVNTCSQVFVDHPWFGDMPFYIIPVAPKNLKIIDWFLRTMRDFPLNDFEKMSIMGLLSSYSYSYGIILREINRAAETDGSPDSLNSMSRTALKHLVKPDQYPDLYPLIISGVYTGENENEITEGNDLDFGLERILDGIEHYLSTKQPK